nr:receptor-like protein 3 [Setaria viridis]
MGLFGPALVALLFFASLAIPCTEQEKSSLLQFVSELSQDGALGSSWDNATDCCKWEGISCSSENTVTDVFLACRNLEGHISPSLGNLTSLLRLNLSHNLLSGGLPLELVFSKSIIVLDISFNLLHGDLQGLPSSTLQPMQVLNISSNLFTGRFPSTSWEAMKGLVVLNASNNSFTGQIPTTFCVSMPSISVLELSYNQFSGGIPPGLGNCSMLTSLDAGSNNLSGNLPDELFNLTLLEHLSFPHNQLEGSLRGISKLTHLVTLDLGGNRISGNIPNSIGDLKRLEELHLDGNSMSWELPSTLGSCTNLRTINLRRNMFSGELTRVDFSTMPNLKTLDLVWNNLTGTIPESIYSCSNLTALRLSGNRFHGQLSERISNLKSLSFLSLVGNSLTNITSALQILRSCRNLATLLIGRNFMHEAMPEDDRIDGFKNLQVFSISRCSLYGKMPPWLLKLTNLEISCTEQEKSSMLQFITELSQDDGLARSWDNTTDCCKWEGITCSSDNTVTGIFLASRSLQGHISPSLGNLAGLLHLNMSHNLLSGVLPMELVSSNSIIVLDVSFNQLSGNLQELQSSTLQPLQVLNISSNLFKGRFPSTTWQMMKSLVALNASNNSFTGQIPSNLCVNAPSLAVLHLSYNQFAGSIPPGLGNCSMLTSLNAGHNNLSGTLPDGLFNLTLLDHLSFPSNQLEGSLYGISKLINLGTLDLGGNSFSGNIPDSIGELKILEELHLDHNSMSGELPSTLSNCINLIIINLKSNSFSGELTKVNFSNLPNLKTLDLFCVSLQNNFNGTIPESIYSCSNLTALRLSSNMLHGQLSESIGNLKSLTFLSLVNSSISNIIGSLQILGSCRNLTTLFIGHNFFNEAMPDDDTIDGFENLQVLALDHCSLSGNIPFWLSKLRNLEVLLLYGNQLTGPVPGWINSLKFLFHINLSNNSLTGEIPTALMDMLMLKADKIAPKVFELPVYKSKSLQYRMSISFSTMLNLGINNFTGVIPENIGQLKTLLSLNLRYNNFIGAIPQSICNLTDLEMLDLSSNHLTGAIPTALNNLHFLSEFNISNNDLEGPIPITGQLSTFPSSSFKGNPKLCGPVLAHHCGSKETVFSPKQTSNKVEKVIFALAFGAFFVVGVVYDQIVLSRYFG